MQTVGKSLPIAPGSASISLRQTRKATVASQRLAPRHANNNTAKTGETRGDAGS